MPKDCDCAGHLPPDLRAEVIIGRIPSEGEYPEELRKFIKESKASKEIAVLLLYAADTDNKDKSVIMDYSVAVRARGGSEVCSIRDCSLRPGDPRLKYFELGVGDVAGRCVFKAGEVGGRETDCNMFHAWVRVR